MALRCRERAPSTTSNPEELRVSKSRPRCAQEQRSRRGVVDRCRKSDAARTSRIAGLPFEEKFGREALDSEKTMDQKPRGRDLFIVDNSVSGWTGLRYLEEWTEIARGFDIATGNFEIGALLALDGKWQKLDKIRILMGAETTYRTRKALLDAVRSQAVEA